MTRINLLSKEVVVKRKVEKLGVLLIVLAIVIVFIAGAMYMLKKGQLISLKGKIEKLDRELEVYKAQKAELEAIQNEKAEIVRRLDAIKQLIEKDRQLWSHLLEEMSKCLPEGVWLTSMRDEGGDRLSIKAVALDNFAVAHYMVNLMQNDYFDGVELVTLSKTSIGGTDARNFDLTCQYIRQVERKVDQGVGS